ncbi:MAG: CoA transferase, partial [Rhizobiaceae bacterium]|nr:CoA transferase [Rhizobiaceae bacterium]
EWQSDERFATAALRGKNIDERLRLTQEVLKTRTTAVWLERLEADDVPCAPVLTRREVIRHPQIIANETIIERDHPVAGKLRQTQPAPRFSKTPTSYRSSAPGLGEQSVEILTEAGLSEDEIKALINDGIVSAS